MPEKSHRVGFSSKGLILMQGRCVLNTSRCQDIHRLVNECDHDCSWNYSVPIVLITKLQEKVECAVAPIRKSMGLCQPTNEMAFVKPVTIVVFVVLK
jgi:hypothetical protein